MILDYICLTLLIFLSLLQWIVIIDVISSWLQIINIKINFAFIKNITYPMYNFIKKYIPTTIWMIDFTPVIIFFWIELISKLIFILNPHILTLLY